MCDLVETRRKKGSCKAEARRWDLVFWWDDVGEKRMIACTELADRGSVLCFLV